MGPEVASNNEANVENPRNVNQPSELEQKIIRQVEYYFGDYNLRRDRFLKEEMQHDSGWIPLETLIKFNRLKQLTEDFSVICEALKKSSNQLMEVNDDNTKVRRIVPVPAANSDDRDEKTLYVKGFKKDMTLDDLLEFFQEYNTEHVFMRKGRQRNKTIFKGSVFVTFKTKEDSEAFFETPVRYNKVPLQIERKKEYMKRKDEFYDKLRSEKERKEKERNENLKKEVEDIKANSKKFEEGCLLKVTGVENCASREELRSVIEKYGPVAYIDYYIGDQKGVIRFQEAIASDVLEKITEEDGVKKIEIGSIKATVSLIEGEEEQQYFEEIFKSKATNRVNRIKFSNKGRFNKKNRGKREKDDKGYEDEPAFKRQKTEQTEDVTVKNSEDQVDHSIKKESEEAKSSVLSPKKEHEEAKSSVLSPKKEHEEAKSSDISPKKEHEEANSSDLSRKNSETEKDNVTEAPVSMEE